jgi:hypothetical protein
MGSALTPYSEYRSSEWQCERKGRATHVRFKTFASWVPESGLESCVFAKPIQEHYQAKRPLTWTLRGLRTVEVISPKLELVGLRLGPANRGRLSVLNVSNRT